ncbi:MAG: hypothetical protein LBV00_07300 [Propionibacteriaceae bacterium]|nr:hypothetical protein [Propionibacteriaceae bacterium]
MRLIWSLPPAAVVLNALDWTRMASGASAAVIVHGDNHGVVQSSGNGNRAVVADHFRQVGHNAPSGDVAQLMSELERVQVDRDRLAQLRLNLEDSSSGERKTVVKSWFGKLLADITREQGALAADALAKLVSPVLMAFVGGALV